MKKTALGKVSLIFAGTLASLFVFAAIGWYFNREYKTGSAILAMGVIAFSVLAMVVSGASGSRTAVGYMNTIAYGAYFIGAVAVVNVLLFLTWKSVPYYGHRSAWAIIVAGLFLFTHRLRNEAEQELSVICEDRQEQEYEESAVPISEEQAV